MQCNQMTIAFLYCQCLLVGWLCENDSVIDMLSVLAAAVSCAIDTQTGALLLDPDTSEEKVTHF